jgi:hypothetical protein
MNLEQELSLAKAPYNWLRVSPIVTIATLFFVASFGIGSAVCYGDLFSCSSDDEMYINIGVGILVSAIWHLLLLQYANNKDSEFIRIHGRRALTFAGIRTAIAILIIVFDWILGTGGALLCPGIAVLLLAWAIQQITPKEIKEREDVSKQTESVSFILEDTPMTINQEDLAQLHKDLQSEDDVVVILALQKVNAIDKIEDEGIKQAIWKALELLASTSDNKDIRISAQTALTRLQEVILDSGTQALLDEPLKDLQSNDAAKIKSALATLQTIPISTEAIRLQLEKIALFSNSSEIREEALALLDSDANRNIINFNQNRIDRKSRSTILREINIWANQELIEEKTADVLKRRYDFDIAPPLQTKPQTAPVTQTIPAPIAPVTPPKPQVPAEPRPSLLQTLTSESAIRIYLYLGAFFVIAAAAILGAVVPELRLPILIVGTLIFGGLSLAIKKRLPQPSFALFIVFSFLLPITANSLAETLRSMFNLTQTFSNGYWAGIFFLMALIWVGGTWVYESRLFSITAFGALLLAFLRLGTLFEVEPGVYTLLSGVCALIGLAGTWLLKKWRDVKFALPLFFAAHFVQAISLGISLIIFGTNTFDPSSVPLWNLVILFTWGLATAFYGISNGLYQNFAFPWLAAATLTPMPIFIATAFDLESLGSAIVLFIWGSLFTITSEVTRRILRPQKYSLPVLIASLTSLVLAVIIGFVHETWLGLLIALGCAVLLTVLHSLHNRVGLWVLALLNVIIAYFAFFQLDVVQRLDFFAGYQVLLIGILLLLPDLLLKKDWNTAPAWRIPLRVFGAAFIAYLSLALILQGDSTQKAVCYFILTLFIAIYALAYRNVYIAYLPTAYLPLAILFTLDAFNLDLWLPALSGLAILYYLARVALHNNKDWGGMLRNSALTLGAILSMTALLLTKENSGWYVLVMGILFFAEMYLYKNGWLEIGAPTLFTLGLFLILRDFNIVRASYQLLAYSSIWILADLLAHLTFSAPRPLALLIRFIGGILSITNYSFLLAESNPGIATFGFGIYTLLFLTMSLLYRQPNLFYTFTLTLPLFATFLFRTFNITQWIHPVIFIAMLYYAAGTVLRAIKRAEGWDQSLLYSGLGLGVVVAIGALSLGGLDASIPVAIAATLWAAEAYARKNAWLAFPANGLYLLAYFIILFELNVDEPQFFSMGTALFGLIQHYLLTRAESKSGTFIMGMFSQFILLGTTYIEMINKNELSYFFLLFLQSLIVLVYGIVIRSRSLTFFPIGFVALGVVTVVYSALKDVGTIFVIGCTGILLLMLGVGAVLLRERIAKLSERLSDWKA